MNLKIFKIISNKTFYDKIFLEEKPLLIVKSFFYIFLYFLFDVLLNIFLIDISFDFCKFILIHTVICLIFVLF